MRFPHFAATCVLALACGAAGALALPAPVLRTPRPLAEGTRALPGRALPAGEGVGGVCGTRVEAITDAVRDHFSRAAVSALPTTWSSDRDGIAVMEDDGTFFFSNKGGNNTVDLAAVMRAFYRTHGDDYDQVAMYLASGLSSWLGSPTALAASFGIRNPVQGIGLETFDLGMEFGSPARLQTLLVMNGLQRYPAAIDAGVDGETFNSLDVLAHEFAHRWLAYTAVDSAGEVSEALLGRDMQHWNFFFDTDSSVMEGNDWVSLSADSFRTDGVTNGYGPLDLYLMGMRSKAETDSFFVVNDASAFDPDGTYVPWSNPLLGLGCRGRATWWHVSDIEAVEGPRLPDASVYPHTHRLAILLLTPHGADATASDLQKLAAIRAGIVPYFAAGTHGFGALDVSLDSHAGRVVIAHTPLRDTEDALAPRPLGARITIAQGGIPLAVDPGSARVFWRADGSGPFTPLPLAPVAPDSFASAVPPVPVGTTVEYYLYAASDSAGIDAFDPPLGPASPYRYVVGPDATPPVVQHVPVPAQAGVRLPQPVLARVTDNLGVDSVWVETSIDDGSIASVPATRAGRDSFAASVGVNLPPGHRVAYRIAARDASLAHHVAYSNAAFDTLRTGTDWIEDFENGAGAYFSQAYWYSYRDAWHLTQEDASPAGGTAWKCGADGPQPYDPHLDANLYTPLITATPGMTLRFDHRYDLEDASGPWAWDGARLEVSVGGGPWQVLLPVGGYPRQFLNNSNPFQQGTPCWSGSAGWSTVDVDLSPYASSVIRIRFRMLADDFYGRGGWFVDQVRVLAPGSTTAVPPGSPALAIGAPWPNPAREGVSLAIALPRAAATEWTLYDVAGRRVAALWKGTAPAGPFELRAALPALAPGVYVSRVSVAGVPKTSARIAIVR